MFATRISRKKSKQTTDRISNLPQNVTQQILECLPLQDATRMSILSSHWRQEQASMSQLLLDRQLFTSILREHYKARGNLLAYTNVIHDILSSHVGPIHKFFIHFPSWLPEGYDISQWIQKLRSHGVKEFTLEDARYIRTNSLPSCLFSCEGLTHLTLNGCIFSSLPATFKGFPCLISLKLYRIYMSPSNLRKVNGVEVLISKCPQLQILGISLSNKPQVDDIEMTISAPKLQDLFVDYCLDSLSLKGTTNIKKLSLTCYCCKYQHSEHMSDFFSNLCKLEKLILGYYFWMAIEHQELTSPTKFPEDLKRLRTLKLVGVTLNCHSSISLVLCLFKSSPHLEQLHIEVTKRQIHVKVPNVLTQIDGSCTCPYLKNIRLGGISGLSNELVLIKFLLACSPALEEMTVSMTVGVDAEMFNFIKEAMSCRRASPIAKINMKMKKQRFRLNGDQSLAKTTTTRKQPTDSRATPTEW